MIKKDKRNSFSKLYKNNIDAIKIQNAKLFPKLAIIGMIITGVSIIESFFSEIMVSSRLMYVVILIICSVLYAFSRVERLRKFARAWLYIEILALYCLVLFLSLVSGKNMSACSMLIVLAVVPLTFIDKPQNLIITDLMMYIVHTILSFLVKDIKYASLDQVNGFAAVIVGCVLGLLVLKTKLQALDFERLLVLEKETDVLTSLNNRRKLIQTISKIEKTEIVAPSGVIMMDIDYFKKYNDTYGHIEGDNYLRAFGKMLNTEDWDEEVSFYRFGGEEFVAFVWNSDAKAVLELANRIHKSTTKLQLDHEPLTLSVGYVICDNSVLNCDFWIEKADIAAYKAKEWGRNRVVQYKENM